MGGDEIWDGHEWENHVLRLLQDQYGAENVQKVPAKHRGDSGLDYFCLEKRVVFQCYSVEGPIGVAERATKQKSKMTTDLGKFCDPARGAAVIFKGYKIKRWILAVPLHDSSEVVDHAMKKTGEVIAKGLAYVDTDFQVLVHDRSDFDDGSWARRMQLRQRIRPIVPTPTPAEVQALAAGDQSLTENLRRKLEKRVGDAVALDGAIDEALLIFLEAENAKARLRVIAPEAYEDVTRLIAQRLRRLVLGSRGAEHVDRLDAEISALKASILEVVPNLDTGIAETIAFGSVSDWLMRCPLRLD